MNHSLGFTLKSLSSARYTILRASQLSLIAAGLLAMPVAAHASAITTLNFGSFAGSSAPGLMNGVVTYGTPNSGTYTTVAGNVVSTGNAAYGTPFAGTQYVGYTAGDASTGITVYETSYTGNLAGYTGTLSVLVDNDAAVYLNGNLLGYSSGYTTTGVQQYSAFQTPAVLNIAAGDYVNGVNTFAFNVYNGSGSGAAAMPDPTALDFSATAVAPTPEPSSLVLLGTGLVGLAGAARRRFSK